VEASLTIGDFAQATHMSVKTLRHYHRVGVLEPADIDPDTGYRRYTADQIQIGHLIRRFRDFDMPLEEIRAVLSTPDLATRNQIIAAHLARLEHRSVAATHVAAISETIDLADAPSWYQGAQGELYATIDAQRTRTAGPAGGIYSNDLFAHERGAATVFVPVDGEIAAVGRVTALELPPVELATIVHSGGDDSFDRAYGALAAHVARHALAVDGPIRERYLIGRRDTDDETAWRTEIGWPIFRTDTSAPRTRG
jgi:DNA-binding transcriptional MerR regulator